MPPRTRPTISDAELAVLKALWKQGPSTVRDLESRLRGKKWAYTTILTLLARLRVKGCVAQERGQQQPAAPHTFYATVTQSELLGRGLKVLAARFCGGAKSPLVQALVKDQLSKSEIAELRQMLDDMEREGGA